MKQEHKVKFMHQNRHVSHRHEVDEAKQEKRCMVDCRLGNDE
jgi:hypothetical protein